MAKSRQEFVDDDLWLLIGVVTFALVSLVGAAGLEALAAAITIVGWFLLAPVFLFWGRRSPNGRLPSGNRRGRSKDVTRTRSRN